MSQILIMDFPVWKKGCIDFVGDISYEVKARYEDKSCKDPQVKGMLKIIHTLSGQSFISRLVANDDAQFSVLLLYRDSSERQHIACETTDIKIEDDKIIAEQMVSINFSYPPEIIPSIVILKEEVIAVADKDSGLDDFWKEDGDITIPRYSRIALGEKLGFTSGELYSLFNIQHKKDYAAGEMGVRVNENASEGEAPVTLLCGQDVHVQLHKASLGKPSAHPKSNSLTESLRIAIVTNALCAVYADMRQLKSEDVESNVLLTHLEKLHEETEQDWQDEDFNPSLAATKMCPYMLSAKIFNDEYDDD